MDIYKVPLAKKPDMEKILAIDQVFRLSITIKDSSILGEEGYQYLILEGTEDRLKVARGELSKISVKSEYPGPTFLKSSCSMITFCFV